MSRVSFPRSEREEASECAPVVLFAGRLVPEKGAHVFVEAMWLLLARGIRARGRLLGATGFGSTQFRDRVTRARSCGTRRRTSSLGDIAPPPRWRKSFAGADIFCSPSVWEEPFGLVNVEAMASGLPVVSTRGGGVPRYLPPAAACWWSGVRRRNWRRRWKG